MNGLGEFCGIGVGPGEPGLIPVAAWEFVKRCDVIFAPRARSMDHSVARRCLPPNEIPAGRFREVEFAIDPDRGTLRQHYAQLAQAICTELLAGRSVAWLTLGDPMTYSTYIHTLAALKDCIPELRIRTYPGVTSYCALAAAAEFPLGDGKERLLILPCPADMAELRAEIESNDIVVLMKIGAHLASVLVLLRQMGIAGHCAFGRQVGMAGEMVRMGVQGIGPEDAIGYLSTMLIRKTPPEKRPSGARQAMD
jgi:precorrin-2/cobalt-factor-2 C20-methyltransferase